MTRNKMLRKLESIQEPLLSLTGFTDGLVCDYMTAQGCSSFELLDWDDLEIHDYDTPDLPWEDMADSEMEEWIERLESGAYTHLKDLLSDSLHD